MRSVRSLCSLWFNLGLVALLLAGCAKDRPPEIIAARPYIKDQTVEVNDSLGLFVSAEDPEKGPLKYHWVAKEGKLSSTAESTTNWTAPDKAGSYKITVTVTDKKGNQTSSTMEVKVTKAAPVYSGSLGGGGGGEGSKRRGAERVKRSRKSEESEKGAEEKTGTERPKGGRGSRKK